MGAKEFGCQNCGNIKIRPSMPTTDIIPGIEYLIAETTRRICGTTEIRRKTRKILKVRSTVSAPLVGSQAMPTMERSKIFQPDRKTKTINVKF